MHDPTGGGISLNLPLLKARFPDIAVLARRGLTVHEIGETLARKSQQSSPRVRTGGFARRKPEVSPEEDWTAVEQEMRHLLLEGHPDAADVYRLLRDRSPSATLQILSILSLRIAGTLGISVKRTTPLVAAALHDIAEHGIRGWSEVAPV